MGCHVRLCDVCTDRRPTRVGVLDDHGGRLPAEAVHEAPRCLSIKDVQVGHCLPTVDNGSVPPPGAAHLQVAGTNLVRVLPVPEVLHPLQGEVNRLR